jgi:peptidyl-tRNA hydrolase
MQRVEQKIWLARLLPGNLFRFVMSRIKIGESRQNHRAMTSNNSVLNSTEWSQLVLGIGEYDYGVSRNYNVSDYVLLGGLESVLI